jgi:cytochrome b561
MVSVPEAVPQDPIRRYSNVAVTIHWLTAGLVVIQIILGFVFAEFLPLGPTQQAVLTWHKTIGVIILLLALVRLAYRLKNPPPPFPPELPKWRRYVAVWNHRLFYFGLIFLPLTGLVTISGMTKGPTTPLVGGIPLPVIPGVDEATHELFGDLHLILVITTLALLALHVGAALYQQFVEHDRTAGRMPPFQAPGGEEPVIGQGGGALPAEG